MNLISSPFYFDNEDVRTSCVEALCLESSLGNNEIVEVNSSSLTLTKADHVGKLILVAVDEFSSAIITLPPDATGGFEDKDQITIIRAGGGDVSIADAEGVTITTTESTTLRKLGSAVQLIRVSANSWFLVGDTVPAESNGIIGVSVPDINDQWNYTLEPITSIGNISYRGVEPTLASNTITIPKLYGMDFECQLDGIQLLSLSGANTSFSIENFTTTTEGEDITFTIGVSPFPIGGEKWLLHGLRLIYTSSVPSWNFEIIQNGEIINDFPITNITDLIEAEYLTSTEQIGYSWDNGVGTDSMAVEEFNGPLYSRVFLSGPITEPISFDLVIDSISNGKGNNLPVRLTLGDGGIIEISANVI